MHTTSKNHQQRFYVISFDVWSCDNLNNTIQINKFFSYFFLQIIKINSLCGLLANFFTNFSFYTIRLTPSISLIALLVDSLLVLLNLNSLDEFTFTNFP